MARKAKDGFVRQPKPARDNSRRFLRADLKGIVSYLTQNYRYQIMGHMSKDFDLPNIVTHKEEQALRKANAHLKRAIQLYAAVERSLEKSDPMNR